MSANFLWYPGASGNSGLLTSAATLLNGASSSSELYGLANAGFIASSASGASGVFNNSNFSQGIWGELFLTLGAIGSALTAGAYLAGWFLSSYDGGTTFEQSSAQPPRSPDFIIPLPATTIAGGAVYKAQGMVTIPALQFKVGILNSTGQTLAAANTNYLRAAPVAMQY